LACAGDVENRDRFRDRNFASFGEIAEMLLGAALEHLLIRHQKSQPASGEFILQMHEQLNFRVESGNEEIRGRLRQHFIETAEECLRSTGRIRHGVDGIGTTLGVNAALQRVIHQPHDIGIRESAPDTPDDAGSGLRISPRCKPLRTIRGASGFMI